MTTNKELLVTLNELRVKNGKAELAGWKSSREKLEAAIAAEQADGADQPSEQPAETQPTAEETSQEPAASDPTDLEGRTESDQEADEAKPEEPAIPRGAIGAMSIELLSTTELPYEDIVAAIKAKYPTAKTTARSLASVAMDLRRDGVDVPSRRKPAKAKEAKKEAQAGE